MKIHQGSKPDNEILNIFKYNTDEMNSIFIWNSALSFD